MGAPVTQAKTKRITKKPADRIDDLISAAVAVFGRVGLDNARVADIVAEAGVAQGTFYLYFKTKDDVLAAIWDRYLDSLLEHAASVADVPDEWPNSLDRIQGSMVRFGIKHADIHRMVYGTANARALEKCRQANERVVRMLAERVEQAMPDSARTNVDVDSMVRMIYHGTHGLLHDLMSHRVGLDIDQVVSLAQEFARRVLTPATR